MDAFDLKEDKPVVDRRPMIWNILTLLMLVGVICVACGALAIFANPYLALNPFPPPPIEALAVLAPTSAVTNTLPPTWTPSNTPPPTPTETMRPTFTPMPTSTLFTIATATPSPTVTITPTATIPPGGYPFELQKGSPIAIANIYHPELACNWMGVGGQVVDMSGAPVTGLIVRLGGDLPGVKFPEVFMSLTGVALNYGRSGYEFTLANEPIASNDSLWIQLLDQAGVPISEKVFFDTYKSCDKNLIIINFNKVK